MAGIGGSDGSFYENHLDRATGQDGNNPDTASGMALEASRKAAGALKSAQGTKPSLDSDVGLRGDTVAGTPDYLRQKGIDTTITSGDVDEGINIGMSTSGGGLSTKGKPIFDYEQMGNGKYEVFNTLTGVTKHVVDDEHQAKTLVDQLHTDPSEVPGTPEFDIKHGYTTDNVQNAMNEIEKILNQMDAEQNSKYPITKPGESLKASDKSAVYKQVPLYYHEKTASWENFPEEVEKLSPKEAFLKATKDAQERFKNTVTNLKTKMFNAFKGDIEGPSVARQGNYAQPAYRGLTVYPGKETNPVYNFDQNLYSSDSPMLADMYAGYLNNHPGYHVAPGTFSEGSQVMPLLLDTRDYHYYDAKGAHWTTANSKAINEAYEKGSKGVIVDNVWDEPNSTKSLRSPKRIFITFRKGAGTVKSRFAKSFDPSSPNILHSIPAIGVGSAGYGFVSHEDTSNK